MANSTKDELRHALLVLWRSAADAEKSKPWTRLTWTTDDVLQHFRARSRLRQPRDALQSLGRRASGWSHLDEALELEWAYDHGLFSVRPCRRPDAPLTGRSSTSICTYSGRMMDIYNPRVEDVDICDIAQAMSREQRFANQTFAPYELNGPVTLASHCCRVARYGNHLWPRIGGAMGPIEKPNAVDRDEFILALLLHDAAETYTRDKPGPQKTAEDKRIERRILEAILNCLEPRRAKRLLAWVESPAGKLVDRLAEAQEALIFHPQGREIAALTVKANSEVDHSLITETLPLFWPRPGESWLSTVRDTQRALRGRET